MGWQSVQDRLLQYISRSLLTLACQKLLLGCIELPDQTRDSGSASRGIDDGRRHAVT